METNGLPLRADEKRFLAGDRGRTLLLLAIAAVVGGGLYFGWAGSPLSGRLQPAQHVENKVRSELDRRFRDGVAFLRARQYAPALAAFRRVLELNPNMPEAHVNAGYALLGMGDFRAAADFFDAATTLHPNQLNAYYGLGEALLGMGDKAGALQAMETYVHRSPASDPFRRKAESATWELREEMEKDRPPPQTGDVPHRRGKAPEGRQ